MYSNKKYIVINEQNVSDFLYKDIYFNKKLSIKSYFLGIYGNFFYEKITGTALFSSDSDYINEENFIYLFNKIADVFGCKHYLRYNKEDSEVVLFARNNIRIVYIEDIELSVCIKIKVN